MKADFIAKSSESLGTIRVKSMMMSKANLVVALVTASELIKSVDGTNPLNDVQKTSNNHFRGHSSVYCL